MYNQCNELLGTFLVPRGSARSRFQTINGVGVVVDLLVEKK